MIPFFHNIQNPIQKTYTKLALSLTIVPNIVSMQRWFKKTNQNYRSLLHVWKRMKKSRNRTSNCELFIITTILALDPLVHLDHIFLQILELRV